MEALRRGCAGRRAAGIVAASFRERGDTYLDTDPSSRSRDPAGVKVLLGPFSDIIKAWHGQLAYDPTQVRVPIAIVRGEWEGRSATTSRWLFDAFTQTPLKRDVKIGRAGRRNACSR
jgi:hypothetical protein